VLWRAAHKANRDKCGPLPYSTRPQNKPFNTEVTRLSNKYPYTATVTISAEDRGGDTEASENPKMRVGLEAVTETLKKVHFVGTLAAPEKSATHICVTLENGLTYYGPIVNGHAELEGGWIAFESDMLTPEELGL